MIADYLILSIILFCIGVLGVVSRRNVFTVFMSIELMLNAANLDASPVLDSREFRNGV